MIKWFLYIVFLLAFTPCLLSAKAKNSRYRDGIALHSNMVIGRFENRMATDTTKKPAPKGNDEKVKEVPKPKKQAKPEKVDDPDDKTKAKPKRERRPDGLQRPPEIPRRIDN